MDHDPLPLARPSLDGKCILAMVFFFLLCPASLPLRPYPHSQTQGVFLWSLFFPPSLSFDYFESKNDYLGSALPLAVE